MENFENKQGNEEAERLKNELLIQAGFKQNILDNQLEKVLADLHSDPHDPELLLRKSEIEEKIAELNNTIDPKDPIIEGASEIFMN